MLGYFNTYIPAYAELMLKFTELLKNSKSDKIMWNEELEEAFKTLNEVITSNAILSAPDFSQGFILFTDVSYFSITGALLQKDSSGNLRLVKYITRKLRGAELNYTIIEKESLVIVFPVDSLKFYVTQTVFEIMTDYLPLIFMCNQTFQNS